MDTDTALDPFESALFHVQGSLLPKERRQEAKEAVRRHRDREDPEALADYMASFEAESAEFIELEHGDFLREFESAALVDVSYAIAIAKPAGTLAARRRDKESPAGSAQGLSDASQAVVPPRVRVCPENHAHGATGSCYRNHSCRCDECRAANSERRKKLLLAQGSTRTTPPKKRTAWTPEPLAEDDPRHGTRNAYLNYRCRCQACTEANRVYTAERRKNPTGTRSKTSEHGTRGRYSRGCRCALCTEAMTEGERQRKKKKLD